MKFDEVEIIKMYNAGKSMYQIAKQFDTHTTTISRILKKHEIEARPDHTKKGKLFVQDGDKLIEWAKAQGRPVTKAELAGVLGKSRLSPSYFIKYPELGKYVAGHESSEFTEYYEKLYRWLNERNIPYKPNDKTKLNVTVDVLLLGDYSNIALQIMDRPKNVSSKVHNDKLAKKAYKAGEIGLKLIGLTQENFDAELDGLEGILEHLKR